MALAEKVPGKFTLTESMNIKPPKSLEKSSLLLKKNPKGLVPVLIDRRGPEEVVVCESLIVVEYIDEAAVGGDKDAPMLIPGTAAQRANARMWADMLNNEICNNFYTLLLKQDKESQGMAAEKILSGLRKFSRHCMGPYFYGEEISIVDITIAPWMVGQRRDVLEHYRYFEVPKTEEYSRYWQWSEVISKRPSFVITTANDLQSMIDVYLPYAEGTGFASWKDEPYCQKRHSSLMGKEKIVD